MLLTSSQIRYLIALGELKQSESGIRCVDIAEKLHFTKPSVHKMIKTLHNMNLVIKAPYGHVFLTDEGKRLAKKYSEYYRVLSLHFQRELNISCSDAKKVTYAVLSQLSVGKIEEMCLNKL